MVTGSATAPQLRPVAPLDGPSDVSQLGPPGQGTSTGTSTSGGPAAVPLAVHVEGFDPVAASFALAPTTSLATLRQLLAAAPMVPKRFAFLRGDKVGRRNPSSQSRHGPVRNCFFTSHPHVLA